MFFTSANRRSTPLGSISTRIWWRSSSTKPNPAKIRKRSAQPDLPSARPSRAAALSEYGGPVAFCQRSDAAGIPAAASISSNTKATNGSMAARSTSSSGCVSKRRWCDLIDEAVGRIKEQIRERTILHDLFFRERLEYPTFAWQEALVNAVAHRDYSSSGACMEVWMFDDHIGVRSPGAPPPPVTLEQLRQAEKHSLLAQSLDGAGARRPRLSARDGRRRTAHVSGNGNATAYIRLSYPWKVLFSPSPCATPRCTTRRRCVGLANSATAQINLRQRRLLAYAYCHGKTFSTIGVRKNRRGGSRYRLSRHPTDG